jgi:GDP-4-dehydro-6-deoxy-D-mannose reductase
MRPDLISLDRAGVKTYIMAMPSSSNKAFITGITGFVGNFLSEHLKGNGFSVAGLDRWPACDIPGVTYFEGDLLDTAVLAEFLHTVKPDRVFHCAAISVPSDADHSPRHSLDVNIMGTASLLDAVRQSCPSARTLVVGSTKQYGAHVFDGPVAETTRCLPTDFYGLSKYAAECIGMQYVKQFGMDVRFSRSFNHTGPGQSPRFVCSDWARQAASIEAGKADPVMRVGDCEPAIDFTDVRDVVKAYALILEKGRRGEAYNVCSGTAIALKDLLALIIGKASKQITVEQDTARLKSHTIGIKTVGDHTKLTRETGWAPEIPMEKTIGDLYEYWLSQIRADAQ